MADTQIGKSFFNALRGIKLALKTQKHIHLHIFIFFLALYSIIFGGAGLKNSLALLAIATMVITAELINSSIEILSDFVSPGYNEFIKNAKDISAGAVLCATFSSIIFAYLILADSAMASIEIFSQFILKTPLVYLLAAVFLFSLVIFLYFKRTYGSFTFHLEKTTFTVVFLVTFLTLYSISVTFVFFLLIGGIILIEALLRNQSSDKVYLTGIFSIIAGAVCFRIINEFHLVLNDGRIVSFIVGACASTGSGYIASLRPSLTAGILSIAGEFVFLSFLSSWGPRFKNSFGKNSNNHEHINSSKFHLLGILCLSAAPFPFSSAVISSSYSVAFSCKKRYSIPVSFAGIILKYFMIWMYLPPYARIGA